MFHCASFMSLMTLNNVHQHDGCLVHAVNIRSRPSLEEGELAGKRKDTRSDKDYDQHQRYSRERSGDRERRSSRYSHERSPGRARRYSRYSHERSPDREPSEWRERSRSPICRRDDKRGSRARIIKAEDEAKKAADDVQRMHTSYPYVCNHSCLTSLQMVLLCSVCSWHSREWQCCAMEFCSPLRQEALAAASTVCI